MNNYQVNRTEWQKLSIFEQMGNIGSEVGRALAAKKRGDSDSERAASIRAFDLLDATSEGLAKLKSPKLREVLRAREQFASAIEQDDQKLEVYFTNFAVATRLRQIA